MDAHYAFVLFLWRLQMAVTKQAMLDAVEAAILARMTNGAVASYSIGGRDLAYIKLSELREMRTELKSEISAVDGSFNYAGFKRPI